MTTYKLIFTINKGRVTSPTDLNLIICKSTLIEIYKVTAEGLKFVKQIGLWGVVENLNIIKLKVFTFLKKK